MTEYTNRPTSKNRVRDRRISSQKRPSQERPSDYFDWDTTLTRFRAMMKEMYR
jgi:hypothetical protein